MGALDYLRDELAKLDADGLLLHPRTLTGPTGARAVFDGRPVINLASNNYLGLANHPRMNAAAARAAAELGAGSGAVRTIAGSMDLHRELEERFAAFKRADAALMFQSGFNANAGTVAAILTPEDVIVSDRLNHASIIDGARLSKAEIKVFEHRDAEHADRLLAETAKPGRRQLLITDGVFSMDGDIAPLPALCDLAEKYGAIMMVDDAHASGVLGRNYSGKGSVDHFGNGAIGRHCRRADDGARRDHAGGNPRADPGRAAVAAHGGHVHHARLRRRRRDCRPRRRHAAGHAGRVRRRRAGADRAVAPVHESADRGDSRLDASAAQRRRQRTARAIGASAR
jgi:hypothetical protein